ncbi:MAG: amidohydrolase [Alphaproteobacteria bacterium]|nr:amidohydrolase [Alphaproteobacteria bacterium]
MAAHDLIVHGGRIVTLDGSSRLVEALGVRDGRIAAAGAVAEVLKDRGPSTRVLDVTGKTVTPGFFDAHPHMDRHGLKQRGGIPIDGRLSIAEIVEIVRQAVARTPKGQWIVLMPMGTPPTGYVYRPDQLTEGRYPTRQDLDAVSPDHPVYIRAVWGWWSHRPFPSVANSRALKLAGVTRDSAAPYNTEIVRDSKGEPTGVFLERNYAPVLEYTLLRVVPRFTHEDRVAGVRLGSAAYSAVGTTAAYEGHGVSPAIIDAYRQVDAAGDLTVRMQVPLSLPSASFDNRKIGELLHHWADRLGGRGSGDGMLRLEGVCVDVGDAEVARIIGEHYPYEQWAGHFYQSLPHDRFVELGVLAARLGLRLNCLVCYDLERVLRAYEDIDKVHSIRDRRWVIIHVIDATPDQLRRIKRLGLVATVTPGFMFMADDRFGLDRLRDRGVPIRELIDAEIPVALSTDNVPHSMLFALWQALSRFDGDSQSALGPSRLGREEALRISTVTGHYLTWEEGRRGPLDIGRAADFVVLGDDPLSCAEDRIKDIPVERTFVAGREVHGPAESARS